MRVTYVYADGVRNLKGVSFAPDPKMNIIMGDNAQGKTNLVEAIWLATGSKSFRGARDKELISFDRDMSQLEIRYFALEREQTSSIALRKNPLGKLMKRNGVKVKTASGLFDGLRAVYFTPDDLNITRGQPEIRRNYVDQCIAQLKPSYYTTYSKYATCLSQRNAVLKRIAYNQGTVDDLVIWDTQIMKVASYISALRNTYTNLLDEAASKLYSELTGGKEKLNFKNRSTVFSSLDGRTDFNGDMAYDYFERLIESRPRDIQSGTTNVGIHRDDVDITLNGVSARDFASQGQTRSISLCMKLAQAQIFYKETGNMPIMLLDDVLSELDPSRQEFILSKLGDMQVFITCCENVSLPNDGAVYHMRGGVLSEE